MGIVVSRPTPYHVVSSTDPDDFCSINMTSSSTKDGMSPSNLHQQTTHWNRMLAPNSKRGFNATGNDK